MFSHICVGSNDITKSKAFYDATFAAIGGEPGIAYGERLIYNHGGNRLIVGAPLNGEPATFANGGTIGINVASPAEAEAWHAAGIANGGTTCEDPPGVRQGDGYAMFLAYLRDPDGNKLCALHAMTA